jgi:hypothetical protein
VQRKKGVVGLRVDELLARRDEFEAHENTERRPDEKKETHRYGVEETDPLVVGREYPGENARVALRLVETKHRVALCDGVVPHVYAFFFPLRILPRVLI